MYRPDPLKNRPDPISQFKEKMNNFLPSGTEKYSVGSKIYNGFSNSPHAGGGLDPSGYKERDQKANAMRENSLIRYMKGRS